MPATSRAARLLGVACAAMLVIAGCGTEDDTAHDDPSPSLLPHPSSSASDSSPGPESSIPSGEATSGSDSPAAPSASPSGASCVEQVHARLSPEERAGQLFMGAIDVAQSPAQVPSALGDARAGAVLLLGNSTDGADAIATAVTRSSEVVGASGGAAPIIAVDQEGGQVQRLRGAGFDDIPSAEAQASMSDLREQAHRWGDQLRAVGVNLNLAPVADVVPESVGDRNQPIAALERGYGSDTAAASESVVEFVRGMDDAGVATSVKHFPGLGKVIGNTDHASGVVDSSTTRDDPDLAPFHAAVGAGSQFVMLSLATYTEIDPDRRAAFSPVVINDMLRDDAGFDGVVVSDDLGAAEQVSDLSPEERAMRYLRAGGDLMIVADAQALLSMTDAVVAEAEADAEFRERVDQSVSRILDTKRQMGLLPCA